ncbi:MAG TPA: hypothetical protein H9936_02860, partial [Candidatus Agathobaculum intestinigallinarum]|nr:hypothetical protein [Candidatus Agathobaculum intestinigallinarum]
KGKPRRGNRGVVFCPPTVAAWLFLSVGDCGAFMRSAKKSSHNSVHDRKISQICLTKMIKWCILNIERIMQNV